MTNHDKNLFDTALASLIHQGKVRSFFCPSRRQIMLFRPDVGRGARNHPEPPANDARKPPAGPERSGRIDGQSDP
jgi:hypothetical protein